MAQELVLDELPRATALFNSTLETGLRAVVVLNAMHPRAIDLLHMTWFDHLVVHTSDIGGPTSLHPDVPQRSGELLVRRRLVEEGLGLMRRNHLLDCETADHGIVHRAREEASALVDSFRTEYNCLLRLRAEWLASFIGSMTEKDLVELINQRIGRWTVEFQSQSDNQVDL
jgi:hypothetical protein